MTLPIFLDKKLLHPTLEFRFFFRHFWERNASNVDLQCRGIAFQEVWSWKKYRELIFKWFLSVKICTSKSRGLQPFPILVDRSRINGSDVVNGIKAATKML